MRVHFVSQGLEEDRILAGIAIARPEKIIIIRNRNKRITGLEDDVHECINKIRGRILSKKERLAYFFVRDIDIDNYCVDFFDFIDALKKTDDWFSAEKMRNNEVSVNLSSGNRIVSCALFCAAMKHGASIFYIAPEYYEKKQVVEATAERLARGIEGSYMLPRITLEYMHNIPFRVLEALEHLEGKANSITEIVNKIMPEIRAVDIRSERMKVSKEVEQLREFGYVGVSIKGREKEVSLTDVGKAVLSFRTREKE
jgi:hypothetical protein